MTKTSLDKITNFNELSSCITNTVSPTILAFSIPDTFGQYWLERMGQSLDHLFASDLAFRIIITQKTDELRILTRESGGPVIFFIKDRQIIKKSMGRVSEKDFMEQLGSIYSLSQAA